MPVGPILERFQLRKYIHHRLHFRPILERQRVREFYNDFVPIGSVLEWLGVC